jgi:Sec-independent protein secretion pathway component TatC
MSEERARGEMPFLEHLEELRWRILWSLAALVAG